MSAAPFQCPDCRVACSYTSLKPWPQGKSNAYAVVWTCSKCQQQHTDISMIGPLVPGPNDCLNCGSTDLGARITCPDCGLPAAHIESYLGLNPAALRKPIGNAKVAFANGLYRQGLALINCALRDDIGLLDGWEMKLDFLHRLQYEDVASSMLELALKAGAPKRLYRQLAALYQDQEDWADAVEAVKIFVAESDAPMQEKAEELSNLGNMLALLDDLEGSENAHAQAAQLDPLNPRIAQNHAAFLIGVERYEEALPVCEQALLVASTDAERGDLLVLQAYIMAEQGMADMALGTVQLAISMGVGDAQTHLLHGRIQAMLGNFGEARSAILKALSIDPDNVYASLALQELDTAMS